MEPRLKASMLWGVIALLTFLVLTGGYGLVTGSPVSVELRVGVAAVVAVSATGVTYLVDGYL
ncbi:hypothetical protein [Natronorarus salvus]|uniref:hypothetical protein n=1 Tax=Natronorarus salvus TaxID=3117733 RepID=UPI002F26050A